MAGMLLGTTAPVEAVAGLRRHLGEGGGLLAAVAPVLVQVALDEFLGLGDDKDRGGQACQQEQVLQIQSLGLKHVLQRRKINHSQLS